MPSDSIRADSLEFFRERYGRPRLDGARQVDRSVLGHDAGLNGYTTVREADTLVEHLALGPDRLLLDLGAGRGWPGSYLALVSGCRVVMTDLPLEALRQALAYADGREVGGHAWAIAAEGSVLPFRGRCFDAITHADVFC